MPAIPMHARLEAHLSDDELKAVNAFLSNTCASLDMLHTIGQPIQLDDPLAGADSNGHVSFDALRSACHALKSAADRALTERAA